MSLAIRTHNLGFPRIGSERALKWAQESYWRGEIDRAELERRGRELRARHWRLQAAAGLDWVPVGDFSWYDHVLDITAMLGAIPERFDWSGGDVDIDLYFQLARGQSPGRSPVSASAMTKWFDTNYHYLVPELEPDQQLRLSSTRLLDETAEALALGIAVKPVLVGPLTWLRLANARRGGDTAKLECLPQVVTIYGQVLERLAALGVEWVQLDEPALVTDLPTAWLNALAATYEALSTRGPKLLLATYFGGLGRDQAQICALPVAGMHFDGIRGGDALETAASLLSPGKVLSAGIVDGRNVWRTDLTATLERVKALRDRHGGELWLAPSCSLLHVPVDLETEEGIPDEIRGWLAFAVQKLEELAVLKAALVGEDGAARVKDAFAASSAARLARRRSARVHKPAVAARVEALCPADEKRARDGEFRAALQRARFDLPRFPTTTIGSFPQTPELRRIRRQWRAGAVSDAEYQSFLRREIAATIREQEALGLDVLVHGEAERNDMVEYFGEQLDGFVFSGNGWVQSYGSRCVKPPIIVGDVSRPNPMTVDWIRYAQSLTDRPVKGMLTGPVTLLNWSFVRDDQPRAVTCLQLALAIRDEVRDLEAAGIGMIQIDEAALREGLPLRRADQADYLKWAVRAFRIASSAAADDTQIHTHMCYSDFNDIIAAVAEMDADVTTIESARSDSRLLDAFLQFAFPRALGPGIYDIHSPRVPTPAELCDRLYRATRRIPADRLWVNPDCGLKTRSWAEVRPALAAMVAAARALRVAAVDRPSLAGSPRAS